MGSMHCCSNKSSESGKYLKTIPKQCHPHTIKKCKTFRSLDLFGCREDASSRPQAVVIEDKAEKCDATRVVSQQAHNFEISYQYMS